MPSLPHVTPYRMEPTVSVDIMTGISSNLQVAR
jgi:hypothetical protein